MDSALALTMSADLKRSGPDTAVEALLALVGDDLARVNDLIQDNIGSSVPLIPRIAGHLIHSGGKRLRPLITLASARMCGYDGDDHIKLAAVIEFIHTATLLHDDVVDTSSLRRGRASANMVWGNPASVLVGDYLFSRSFNLMVEVADLRVLDILATASSVIAEGEILQLASTAQVDIDKSTYLDIVASKTAALFAAAARVGPVIAGRPRADEASLESYGRNLGTAFQLADDALDYIGSQLELGKTPGDDFREGKITLPLVLAFAKGDEEEREFWRRVIAKSDRCESDFVRARALMRRRGALRETLDLARRYGERARQALHAVEDNAYRRALDGVIGFCVDREY